MEKKFDLFAFLKKWKTTIGIAIMFIVLLCLAITGLILSHRHIPQTEGGSKAEEAAKYEIEISLANEDLTSCRKQIKAYRKTYGESDYTKLIEARIIMCEAGAAEAGSRDEKKYEAENIIKTVEDQHSQIYYLTMLEYHNRFAGGNANIYMSQLMADALTDYPEWYIPNIELGFLYMERDDWDSAIFFFDRTAKLFPDDGISRFYLGVYECDRGEYANALLYFEEAQAKENIAMVADGLSVYQKLAKEKTENE